jgi:hypothetical protein
MFLLGVTDLNMQEEMGEAAGISRREHAYVCWQGGFRSTHGPPAFAHLSAMRGKVSWAIPATVLLSP